VGPRDGLDDCKKLAPPGFDPRTVQPVGSRYTDYAIPARPMFRLILIIFGTEILYRKFKNMQVLTENRYHVCHFMRK
jgi:hypothetical protein